MSTDINSVAGKARNLGVNTWLVLLGIAVLVFGLNTGYATWKAARLGGASSAASNLQVLSQQLANQGREAVGGDAQAFNAFKDTKAEIDDDIASLNGNFGNEPGVSGPIGTVTETWTPLGASAEQMIASERAVLGLADNANSFAGQVPQLQANLDELVRAMSASGSPSSQVYLALRQVVLSGTMARRITEIQAGGPAAATAGDALARDAAVFDNVMTGLREGDETLGVTALSNGGALAALGQAQALWTDMKEDLDAILSTSQNLFRAQAAADSITAGSDQLLTDSRRLFDAFTAFGSLRDTSILGNLWISIISGALALVAIAGLLYSLNRQQQKRYETTKELNDRNQEAIMRLLDEMGSLAEGDLTVKATVTEDMTGAIADSINFAVEQLRSLVQTITDTSVQVASSRRMIASWLRSLSCLVVW